MNINELYQPQHNERDCSGQIVADFIKRDGFDITPFSLFQVINGTWEFISEQAPQKGFLIFFNPDIECRPVAGYEILCDNIAFT